MYLNRDDWWRKLFSIWEFHILIYIEIWWINLQQGTSLQMTSWFLVFFTTKWMRNQTTFSSNTNLLSYKLWTKASRWSNVLIIMQQFYDDVLTYIWCFLGTDLLPLSIVRAEHPCTLLIKFCFNQKVRISLWFCW